MLLGACTPDKENTLQRNKELVRRYFEGWANRGDPGGQRVDRGERLAPGSQLRAANGRDQATEGYHCRYGLNPEYPARLAWAGLRFSGFDHRGEVRAFELPSHPFFIRTPF